MYKLSKAERKLIEQFRGVYDLQIRWYVVMTHWGHEQTVLQCIRKRMDGMYEEILLPEIAANPGEKSQRFLLSGYLFLRCRMSDEIYMAVTNIAQVYKIFGKAFRIPEPIDDQEMALFKRVLISAAHPQLVTRSNVGKNAVVVDGLMKGLTGRVVEINAQHVKLETRFSFLAQDSSMVVCAPHAHVRIEGAPVDSIITSTDQRTPEE